MSSLILAVQSFPLANETIERHWPYYLNAEADDIVGIGTTDGLCKWPSGVDFREIGENKYIEGDHLPRRLIDTIRCALDLGSHTQIAVIEYDVLFFRPIPRNLPMGLTAHLAGGPQEGRKGKHFFHGPWICDRITASLIVACGDAMLSEGDYENGSPDCFIGWLCERFHIPVHSDVIKTYSRNSLDIPDQLEEARQARMHGAVAIHGCKSVSQLKRLLED